MIGWVGRIALAVSPFVIWFFLAGVDWSIGFLWLVGVLVFAALGTAIALCFRTWSDNIFHSDRRFVLMTLGLCGFWVVGALLALFAESGAKVSGIQARLNQRDGKGLEGFRVKASARLQKRGKYTLRLRYFTEAGVPHRRYSRGGMGKADPIVHEASFECGGTFPFFPKRESAEFFVPYFGLDPTVEMTSRVKVRAELLHAGTVTHCRELAFFHEKDWYHFNEFTRKFIDLREDLVGLEAQVRRLANDVRILKSERRSLEGRMEKEPDAALRAGIERRLERNGRRIEEFEDELASCRRLAKRCILMREDLLARQREERFRVEQDLLDKVKARIDAVKDLLEDE